MHYNLIKPTAGSFLCGTPVPQGGGGEGGREVCTPVPKGEGGRFFFGKPCQLGPLPGKKLESCGVEIEF